MKMKEKKSKKNPKQRKTNKKKGITIEFFSIIFFYQNNIIFTF